MVFSHNFFSWSAMDGHSKREVLEIFNMNKKNVIGHFHDDDIWLQLPEFISFLLSYLNLSIPLRIKEQ